MRPVINSEKRIVQVTLATAGVGVVAVANIVNAQQDPSASSPAAVRAGTIVKAVYAEIWLIGASSQPPTATAMILKTPAGASAPDATEMTDLNGYTNKKNILEMHQGLVGDANTNPVPFFRGWIKIPKGKQRFGLGDQLRFVIKSITEDTNFCGVFIFKAYN